MLATCAYLNEEPVSEGLIGRPMSNKRVYLLDRHGEPVPVGVPGEIFIGGKGVAVGYLGRPDLTGERFIPNPFDPRSETRLYRSGDMARWHEDGTLSFEGRRDRQVKVGGFRVEPEEVEGVLESHPLVGDAVVVVLEEGGGSS